MKNILIINGHPDKESFCFALAESYKMGADKANTNVKLVHLIDLKFNPILTYGYRKISELEPDLLAVQKDICLKQSASGSKGGFVKFQKCRF